MQSNVNIMNKGLKFWIIQCSLTQYHTPCIMSVNLTKIQSLLILHEITSWNTPRRVHTKSHDVPWLVLYIQLKSVKKTALSSIKILNNVDNTKDSQDLSVKILAVSLFVCLTFFFLTTLCSQVSLGRPTRAVTVTSCQAVMLVTYFVRHKTDAVSLTLQSALKHYYPPVILLIPWKHPVVTSNVVQALDRTWYRMWFDAAVSVSLTNDTFL